MKKHLAFVPLVLAAASPALASSDVGFDLNINIGNKPRVVVPAPAPVPVVVIEEPPVFITPPGLGFFVAVDVPYDIFYISGSYFLFRDDHWYRSSHYRGPWGVVKHKHLPPGLRKHRIERIRHFRDDEYRVYRGEHDHYRGKRFRPEKEFKEHRKEERRHLKEERKREKEEYEHRGKGRGRGHDD